MTDRVEQVIAVLPRGNSLDDVTFTRRHRLLLALMLVHVPGLILLCVAIRGWGIAPLLQASPLLLAGGVGMLGRSRLLRSMAVALGLVYAASVAVFMTGGLIEAHFHFFVVLGVIALYQDWRPYAFAVAYVVLAHAVLGTVAPQILYNHPAAHARPWLWAGVHSGFVLAICATQVIFWKLIERQQEEAKRYFAELYEGERAVVAQLRQTQQLKDELVSVVGHEFRTPLTSIMGYAQTLSARLGEMDPVRARSSAKAIERQAKRLTRMVANLLTASGDLGPVPGDATSLSATAAEVVEDILELEPAAVRDLRLHLTPGHRVAMSASAAYQVLFNLVDNAVKFAERSTDICVTTRRDDDAIVLEVTNVGPSIPEPERERIFAAFVQGDSSETRRYGGIGLGLHIVRKVVEAHGGRVGAYCEGPVVIFRVWLPEAPEEQVAAVEALSQHVG